MKKKEVEYKQIFIVESRYGSGFHQLLSCKDGYIFNIDGKEKYGPFKDTLQCLEVVTEILVNKKDDMHKKKCEFESLINSW